MKSVFAQRAARKKDALHTVPPATSSSDYDRAYADIAASILYKSPSPSQAGLPIYILNAAAFPDSFEVDYDFLLPYVLGRLPDEDQLIAGAEYEVIFFAGGQPDTATGDKKNGPGITWYIQVYQVLSRALRKRLQKIYIVHERSWVRVLTEVFGTIVSGKFKRKIFHISSLSTLAMHIPIENLLIPPAVYLYDRKVVPDVYVPYATGPRAFSAFEPLPKSADGTQRIPRVLREASNFILKDSNLNTEGIFRITPHSLLLGILREAYDRGQRFIIWREAGTTQADPGIDAKALAEVHESDAYGVHLAAGLIKTWYRQLRRPVVPERCYASLRSKFASPDTEVTKDDLTALFSTSSTSSPISLDCRKILTRHMFPFLSIVASHEAANRMSADNLAICFAPALVRGNDPMQDAKVSSVVRRLLQEAITTWPNGLAEACESTLDAFYTDIRAPTNVDEYEDPLVLGHDDDLDGLQEQMSASRLGESPIKRAMPPPRSSSLAKDDDQDATPPPPLPKRKPAPNPAPSPRYSTLEPSPPSINEQLDPSPAYEDAKTSIHNQQNGFLKSEKRGRLSERIQAVDDAADQSKDALSIRVPRTDDMNGSTKHSNGPTSPLLSPSLAEIQRVQLRSVSGDSAKSADEHSFVKPTWAASSRKGSASSAISTTSYRKPTPPPITPRSISSTLPGPENGPQPPAYIPPKPRSPSPALLQRMQSWEKEASDSADVVKPDVGGRKQSVEDLRRIYEERASAVITLSRTSSNASTRSRH